MRGSFQCLWFRAYLSETPLSSVGLFFFLNWQNPTRRPGMESKECRRSSLFAFQDYRTFESVTPKVVLQKSLTST